MGELVRMMARKKENVEDKLPIAVIIGIAFIFARPAFREVCCLG